MLIPRDIVDEAKRKLGQKAIEIIVRDLEIDFDDKNLKGNCPFHDEDTPSFIWNEDENCFHCFGCSINYGYLDHLISFYNMSYIEAVKKLLIETESDYRIS